MKLSVVTVTHNSREHIVEMLASIDSGVEVVVVDNASTDGTPATVAGSRADVVLVDLPTNGGFGRGCNIGAGVASGEILVFLNPDCRPAPGALLLLAERVAAEPGSIFGPALLHDDGSDRYNLRRASRPHHEILELMPSAKRWVPWRWRRDLPPDDARYVAGGAVDYLQGACLAVARDCFMAVRGFDEDYFLYSEEETLCQAIIAAGGECVYAPDAIVAHVGGTSTEAVSRFAVRHLYRSRAIFYRKQYGELRGHLSALAICAAALYSWLFHLVASPREMGASRMPQARSDLLCGLIQGMLFRVGRIRSGRDQRSYRKKV
jgi:hypothetical protein